LLCSDDIRIVNNSKLLLQLERVNLSAAQTLRAAFIKVRSNLKNGCLKGKPYIMMLKSQLSCFLVSSCLKTASLIQ